MRQSVHQGKLLSSIRREPGRHRQSSTAGFDAHLQSFISMLQSTGLATRSLDIMHGVLVEYTRWLRKNRLQWLEVDKPQLVAYLAILVDARAADSTIRLRRWMLDRLYGWAVSENLRQDNPASRLAAMRARPRSLKWVPSIGQVTRLLTGPDPGTAQGMRDRAILELLYATGLRASELVGLQSHQIDRKNRVIRLVGKGSKERIVVYGAPAAHWLERYLNGARQALLLQRNGYPRFTRAVFVNPTQNIEMKYFHLHRLVRRYGQQADLPLMTPHVLRHAFASHMQQRGADLRVIQMLLGHSDLSTTTIYLAPSGVGLRAVLERHHPLGRYFTMPRRATFRCHGDMTNITGLVAECQRCEAS